MNTYVVMSWSPQSGARCAGVSVNRRTAENLAEHAVEDYIGFAGCGGAISSNDELTEFWPEKAPDAFKVRIDAVKLYINFANR